MSLRGATLEGSSPTALLVVGLRPSYRHAGRPPLLAPSTSPPHPSLACPHGASGVRYQPFSGAPRSLSDDPRSPTSLLHHHRGRAPGPDSRHSPFSMFSVHPPRLSLALSTGPNHK
ncbi:hypothetical protein E2C01_063798 [Portunus trituberculatus]|uniref:Uncharacterized protein n=1 Tax=Portunus trituberculatus TaxID=210409 RepID=A0A5B7HIM1_PORTR|nr:hypothetical protein [Portunus trituberculatus]